MRSKVHFIWTLFSCCLAAAVFFIICSLLLAVAIVLPDMEGCLPPFPPPLLDPEEEEEEEELATVADDDELGFSPLFSLEDLAALSLLSLWLGRVGSVFQPVFKALFSALVKPLVGLAARLARPFSDWLLLELEGSFGGSFFSVRWNGWEVRAGSGLLLFVPEESLPEAEDLALDCLFKACCNNLQG